MNFLELQNFVLSDRFSESKRDEAKLWINSRYGRMWNVEPWTFKFATEAVTLDQGEFSAPLLYINRIYSVKQSTGSSYDEPILARRPEQAHGSGYIQTNLPGTPNSFTVVQNSLIFNRPASASLTFNVYGEQKFTPLSGDTDIPAIPEEFHVTLAHGAMSEGLRLEADPAWEGAEQDYQAGIDNMKKSYLTNAVTYYDSYPGWP